MSDMLFVVAVNNIIYDLYYYFI